jgi:hypothetical protein
MAEQRVFSAKQVGLIVLVAVCCCLVVFLAVSWKTSPTEPYGTALLRRMGEARSAANKDATNNFGAAYDKAYAEIQLERTRRAAEDAAWEARQARLKR